MRLLLFLLVASRALACDPILLDLIRGQERVSVFDQAIEGVSTKLNDVAAYARSGDWEKGTALLGVVQQSWIGVYAKYYLSRPSEPATTSGWQATFDSVSQDLGSLGKLYAVKDFEKLHPVVRNVQDRLIRFYRQRLPETPQKAFERARTMAQRLGEQAARPDVRKRDLGETFLYLDQQVRRLPLVDGAPRDKLMAALRAADAALGKPQDAAAAARRVDAALETYRQQALEKLWFSRPAPGGKDVSR
ncbi:MAG: hypothetical protein HY303_05270 [Candidatus Wallbacteria bacterium]|nr:hypothetical protein [Candidatus Wallbacteria bacterium]